MERHTMQGISTPNRLAMLLLACSVSTAVAAFTPAVRVVAASAAPQAAPSPLPPIALPKPKPDLSGRKQVGIASFYARMFTGRKMADGKPMDPNRNNAASRTLPLGTIAMVTNLDTEKSAIVTIQDRGPYVKGRIVDLSPSTASKIGLTQDKGLARVEVVPIVVPLPDGSVKVGEAMQDPRADRVSARNRGG
jgi:rare lipoprotein A